MRDLPWHGIGVKAKPSPSRWTWFLEAFYIDTVDLTLPGPFPLQLRRNYFSQNLSANEFGYCWKMNFTPYLVVTTNAGRSIGHLRGGTGRSGHCLSPDQHIRCPGWFCPQDNPSLNNNSIYGVGGQRPICSMPG